MAYVKTEQKASDFALCGVTALFVEAHLPLVEAPRMTTPWLWKTGDLVLSVYATLFRRV